MSITFLLQFISLALMEFNLQLIKVLMVTITPDIPLVPITVQPIPQWLEHLHSNLLAVQLFLIMHQVAVAKSLTLPHI